MVDRPGSQAGADPRAPRPAEPPSSVETLRLPPYNGPKSHHASRAFAEMQERARKRRRRIKIAVFAVALVVGGALLWTASLGVMRWLQP